MFKVRNHISSWMTKRVTQNTHPKLFKLNTLVRKLGLYSLRSVIPNQLGSITYVHTHTHTHIYVCVCVCCITVKILLTSAETETSDEFWIFTSACGTSHLTSHNHFK